MPPGAEGVVRLHILFLVMRAFLLALVEWMLETDVGFDFPFGGLLANKSRNVEGLLDLDLLGYNV